MLALGVLALAVAASFAASAEFIEIERPGAAAVDAYLYRPSGKGPFPGVVVLHHSRGLTDDVKNFADALADQGYVTVAVELPGKVNWLGPTAAAYDYLQKLPNVDARRVAFVGFSKGARLGMQIAALWKNERPARPVRAFVSYYVGNSIDVEPTPDLPPILFLHGENDPEVRAKEIVAFCDEQKRLGKICEAKIYAGTSHAFTRRTRYGDIDVQATADAFKRTVAFLNQHLRDAPIR